MSRGQRRPRAQGRRPGADPVARLLESRLRSSDVLARLGGDEFVVIAPKATRRDAERLAGQLVELIESDPYLRRVAETSPVTASIEVRS
ncbi:MAG: diguanylate cyclase [Ilumatobacteraceae bacterium]